jgi:L-asparagine transporter-like permease
VNTSNNGARQSVDSEDNAGTIEPILKRESGLERRLGSGQMSMIAIGGAIGTGLFLGLGFAISIAGPAVLLSYAIGAVLALLLVGCLAEMTVAHPTAGSFGSYAEHYLGPMAGFLVRYVYWVGNVLAIGTEVAAIAIYMKYWFPSSPGWFWSAGFSLLAIGVNTRAVNVFGTVEYWFSAIKLTFIGVFLLMCGWFLLESPLSVTASELISGTTSFFPHGATAVWKAVILAVFSYMGIETIAVAAGESQQPAVAVRQAFRSTVLRLILFYLGTLSAILAILPWRQAGPQVSPFVQVMQTLHWHGAADFVNAAVLIAALSAINSQLYIASRMMFSLARAGSAPKAFGRTSRRGIPVNALLASSTGIALAAALTAIDPQTAYASIVAVSVFSAIFTWLMIFVTHYFFRRRGDFSPVNGGVRMPGFPATTLGGAACMLAILVTTFFTPEFRLTLLFGIALLVLLSSIYFFRVRHT